MKPKEFARVYDSEAFVEYTRESPSIVSRKTPCVCAHITPLCEPPSGTGRKHDAKWVVPLTWEEHQEMHRGEDTFARKYNVDLDLEAAAHWSRWREQG